MHLSLVTAVALHLLAFAARKAHAAPISVKMDRFARSCSELEPDCYYRCPTMSAGHVQLFFAEEADQNTYMCQYHNLISHRERQCFYDQSSGSLVRHVDLWSVMFDGGDCPGKATGPPSPVNHPHAQQAAFAVPQAAELAPTRRKRSIPELESEPDVDAASRPSPPSYRERRRREKLNLPSAGRGLAEARVSPTRVA